ncbi:putative leucine-rich repeat-containing protein DDB_G0290503 [Chironomus tepperi]|uniref:putative leucine-rich repeat-containing protein DDB_G0290503 n=1 Tax=Chironomus tepperi TaxID=113505 RepID=UPI00391F5C0F
MLKVIFVALCLIAAFCGSSTSTNIECDYGIAYFYVVGKIYRCTVNNNLNIISEESAQISGISGTHVNSSYSNDDVLGFRAERKIIEVFPKGLHKIFKNIKVIWISSCELKEIHQSDLKAFPHLVYFYLYSNKIEIIEEGLFDFNPNLEAVGFEEPNIIHIDPNVFDNLSKLRYFWFRPVPCIAQFIYDSKEKVQSVLKIVKSKCTSADFLSLDTQLKNLESESKTLNSEAFSAKLESFEKSFQNSKFFKIRYLKSKFEILKNEKCSNCKQLRKIESIDTKLTVVSKTVDDGQKKINEYFEDVKSSQCGLKSPFIDLKSSQDSIQTSLNSLKLTTDGQGTKLDHIQKYQNQLISLHAPLSTSINNIVAKLDKLTDKFTSLTDKFTSLTDKVESLESIEPHLIEFEGKMDDKFVRIEKELSNKLHRMSLSFDEKFKGIETRLVKKIEKILEDKLANVLQFF